MQLLSSAATFVFVHCLEVFVQHVLIFLEHPRVCFSFFFFFSLNHQMSVHNWLWTSAHSPQDKQTSRTFRNTGTASVSGPRHKPRTTVSLHPARPTPHHSSDGLVLLLIHCIYETELLPCKINTRRSIDKLCSERCVYIKGVKFSSCAALFCG